MPAPMMGQEDLRAQEPARPNGRGRSGREALDADDVRAVTDRLGVQADRRDMGAPFVSERARAIARGSARREEG